MSTGSVTSIPASVVVPSLVRWGVSADADLVYRAIATFGPQSVTTAARELGMAPRRVADALEELAAHRAVVSLTAGRRRRSSADLWRAEPPDRVIHLLRRSRLRLVDPWELAQRHFAGFTGLGLPTSPDDVDPTKVRLLRGMPIIRERVAELSALERYEHLAMNPEQAISAPSIAAAAPLDRAVLMRGVKLSILAAPPADGDRIGVHGTELTKLGAKARFSDTIPLKVLVFDRKVAIIPIDLRDTGAGALEITDPALLQGLVSVVTREWEGAPDPSRTALPSIVLTPRERDLIDQLAAGHTDSMVSRRLGVSTRTIGYTLRGLMDRLNVENRFQLGLALGSQGVYTPSGQPQAPRDGADA